MNKVLNIEYEVFEEDNITVLSVVDIEKDAVLKMFEGKEAEDVYNLLTKENEHDGE